MIRENHLDHDQQVVVQVFVNENQQLLLVVDQVQAVVPVQVFGDFIRKIRQVLKLDQYQYLSWVWSLLPVYLCYTYGENIPNKTFHFFDILLLVVSLRERIFMYLFYL